MHTYDAYRYALIMLSLDTLQNAMMFHGFEHP